MGQAESLWQAGTIVIEPDGAEVAITDAAGAPVASCDTGGAITGTGDEAFATATLLDQGRRPKPGGVGLSVSSPGDGALGGAKVSKYRIGPKARKVTLAITNGQGEDVARLEPRDKRGVELELTASGSAIATVGIEQVKSGFMRKRRVYTARLSGDPGQNAALLLAVLIRYDAVLNEVVSAAGSDD